MKLKLIITILKTLFALLGGESQKDAYIHFEVSNKIVVDYENKISKK